MKRIATGIGIKFNSRRYNQTGNTQDFDDEVGDKNLSRRGR
jgi:hypothetical protein